MSKYLLSGYYGFDNIGDEAILMSLTAGLKSIDPKIEITALSANPQCTADRYNVRSINRNNILSILREIRACDYFVSGGGSLLQDVTGWKSIPYYLGQVLIAQLMGRKTVFYAQGIGPVKGKFYRWLIRKVMNRANYISVRDSKSKELLIDWGIDANQIKISVDPVFILRNLSEDYTNSDIEIKTPKTPRPLIGVSVRPWGNEYIDDFAESLSKFAAEIDANIIIIPFHINQDQGISKKLKEKVISRWNEDDYKADIILSEVETPLQVISLYKELDFLLGVRLHSLIFSVLKNVPFVAIEYDPKITGFLNMIGINSSVDINNLDGEQLYKVCYSVWSNNDNIKEILEQQGNLLAQIAMKDVNELV